MKSQLTKDIASLRESRGPDGVEAFLLSLHEQEPTNIEVLNKLASFYHLELKEHRRALVYFRQLIPLYREKRDIARVHYNIGCVLMQLGEYRDAVEAFDLALALVPALNAKWNKCLSLLHAGEWLKGMELYGARHEGDSPQVIKLPQLPLPRVRFLDDLARKNVLILGEQGFGDSIFFARMLPLVAEQAGNVYVKTYPELKTLFDETIGGVHFFDEGSIEVLRSSQLECWATIGDLFATSCSGENRFPSVRRFRVDYGEAYRLDNGNTLKVGVCWACNPASKSFDERSIAVDELGQLAGIEEIQCYSFQKDGETAPDWMVDLRERLDSFHDTAAYLEQMDLVVTVDTALAHLAGALMRPTLLVFRNFLDWKWKYRNAEGASVFYPTMKFVETGQIQPAIETFVAGACNP